MRAVAAQEKLALCIGVSLILPFSAVIHEGCGYDWSDYWP